MLVEAYLKAVNNLPNSHAYASLLGFGDFDTEVLESKVSEGFRFSHLVSWTKVMDISLHETADLLFISPRSLQRRRTGGRLQSAESDHLLRLSRVLGRAIQLFDGDKDAAVGWMKRPLAALGARSPLALSRTEPGALEVERLIGRLEHGVFS